MFRKSKTGARTSAAQRLRGSHQSLNASIASHNSHTDYPDSAAMVGKAPITLNLGDYDLVYEDGCWHSGARVVVRFSRAAENVQSGQPNKEVATLRKRVQDLSEENNMLKFKMDVLLDMLAVGKADLLTAEKELDTLRNAAGQNTARR